MITETIVRGYKCNIRNINEIEKIIERIRAEVLEKIKKEYKELLTIEIERLFDDICLNKAQRPNDDSIFNVAKSILDEKIKTISLRNEPLEYNFNLSIYILLDEENTYFRVNSNNFIYSQVFNNISELEEYSLSSFEAVDNSNEKNIKWRELMKKYNDDAKPISVSIVNGFFNFDDITPETLIFTSPKDRINSLAHKEALTRIFNSYGMGKPIPPLRTMDYIEDAVNRIENSAEVKSELELIRNELSKVIIPITTELIS